MGVGRRRGWLLEGESEENDTAVCRTVGHSRHTGAVKLLSINLLCSPTAEVIHKMHEILAAGHKTAATCLFIKQLCLIKLIFLLFVLFAALFACALLLLAFQLSLQQYMTENKCIIRVVSFPTEVLA